MEPKPLKILDMHCRGSIFRGEWSDSLPGTLGRVHPVGWKISGDCFLKQFASLLRDSLDQTNFFCDRDLWK